MDLCDIQFKKSNITNIATFPLYTLLPDSTKIFFMIRK